jgi:transcription factor C subunit 6
MHEHQYAMSNRRSRAKQPKSYRVEEAYSFLDEEDGSGLSETQTPQGQEAELDDGDDFMPDIEQEEAEDDFDEEEEIRDEEESEPESPTDDGSVVRASSVIDLETPSKKTSAKRAQKRKATTLPQVRALDSAGPVQPPANFTKSGGMKIRAGADKMRSRGVADFSKAGGQEMRLKDLFGPATSDLRQVLRTIGVLRKPCLFVAQAVREEVSLRPGRLASKTKQQLKIGLLRLGRGLLRADKRPASYL